ncbi:MAG: 50S ribosomal protein L11 [Candidatus Jorgensenbacteria bacterium GW2011_GWB1_49_9]|nr:MAG: 50S ribosomal protein L11 [Candidatus Jorgensenbacteria bacterium GW2011_GWB1_49_9]
MAKPIKTVIKLQTAPPIGTALGPQGVNIQQFCQQFNEATKSMAGDIVPAEITIYLDRSFDFKLKTPPASSLIKKAAGIEKGSPTPHSQKIGKITRADLRQIAEKKMVDLNTQSLEAAEKIIEGTARNMGITIE